MDCGLEDDRSHELGEETSEGYASLPRSEVTKREARPPFPLVPVTIVVGHYGVGKTNFSLNLALDAAARGCTVELADMDVVNPYFRSSDYETLLSEQRVHVIAPVLAGTTLDGPSISNELATAIEETRKGVDISRLSEGVFTDDGPSSGVRDGEEPVSEQASMPSHVLIVDAGGDDVGATALGRFSDIIAAGPYSMLYVVNHQRNLTQEPEDAAEVLHEIETRCRLRATAIVNNTHLKEDTDRAVIERGISFAEAVAAATALPLVCTTVPLDLAQSFAYRETDRIRQTRSGQTVYPVRVYVRTPWE